MFLPEFATKRSITVFMIFIAVIVLGMISLGQLSIDLYPDISFPMAMVITNYFGVGPEEIESMVTRPLEMSLSTVTNLKNIYSYSLEDISAVMLELEWGTDMDMAALDIREKVDIIRGTLPEDAENPWIFKFDPSMMPILFLGISGDNQNLAELRTLAEDVIQPRLERLEGIASASVMGGLQREIRVELDRSKMEALGISTQQVIGAIRASNLNLPAGHLRFGQKDFLIRTTGQFTQVSQLNNVVLSNHNSVPTYLSDVAEIKDDFKEKTSSVTVDGKESLLITVQRESQANTVQAAKRVKKALAELKEELPQGVKINSIFDASVFIERSVDNVKRAALEGGLLAVIIILVFLRNFSSTIIISTAIPISVIATFILLYFGKMTLNIATLGGLALGVGRLVDDSIVVLENIFRHRQRGERPSQAAQIGASEVSSAVLAATATTIAVFVPILFVTGIAGIFFTPMAYTVSLSLAASYFVAMVLIPLLSSRFLKVKRIDNPGENTLLQRLSKQSQRVFDGLDDYYQRVVGWAITHKKTVIFIVLAFLVITLPLVKFIGAEFMPQIDEGEFDISVKMPVGTDLNKTRSVVSSIENTILEDVPELKTLTARTGLEGKGWAAMASIFRDITGSHAAVVGVELSDVSQRERSVFEVMDSLRSKTEQIPDADVKYTPSGIMTGMTGFGGAPISVEIRGYDQQVASDLAQQILELIKGVPGTKDARVEREAGLPELQIRIDRDKASDLGLNVSYIANTIQTNMEGSVASFFRDPKLGKEYDILVQLKEEDRKNLFDLDRISLVLPTGGKIPLSSVTRVVKAEGPTRIERKNQQRMLMVTSQVSGRPAGSVAREVQTKIRDELKVPSNFTVAVTGTYEDQQESFKSLFFAFLLAVALVYMVLAAQFESLLEPFIIMFSVPLGILGVIWGLFLTGFSVNVLSLIGVIMMAGIVVSNAILLVDYSNVLLRRGQPLYQAVVTAGRTRLRPVLMTTLTTMFALLPLAIGLGEGSEVQSPMAVSVISGLLVSTILTLIFIPTLYTIVQERIRKRR